MPKTKTETGRNSKSSSKAKTDRNTKKRAKRSSKTRTKSKVQSPTVDVQEATPSKKGDGTFVFTPQRDLIAAYATEQIDELRAVENSENSIFAIDLSNVSAIDGSGLAVLVQCHNSLKEVGKQFIVLTDKPDLKTLFAVTRLDQHLTIREAL